MKTAAGGKQDRCQILPKTIKRGGGKTDGEILKTDICWTHRRHFQPSFPSSFPLLSLKHQQRFWETLHKWLDINFHFSSSTFTEPKPLGIFPTWELQKHYPAFLLLPAWSHLFLFYYRKGSTTDARTAPTYGRNGSIQQHSCSNPGDRTRNCSWHHHSLNGTVRTIGNQSVYCQMEPSSCCVTKSFLCLLAWMLTRERKHGKNWG